MRTLTAWCAAWLYRGLYATLRVRYVFPDRAVGRASDYPVRGLIFALSERDAFAIAGLMTRRRFTVLVAHGRDGGWATAILEQIGCRVIRGSSRRGGDRALRELLRVAQASDDPVGLVVDGPLGPAGVAKPGAVICAAKSGRRLLAVTASCTRRWTLPRTWSNIYLPLPFSTVMIGAEFVEAGADSEGDEQTQRLTRALAQSTERANAVLEGRVRSGGVDALRPLLAGLQLARDLAVAIIALPFLLPLWLFPWRAAVGLGRWYGYVAWAISPKGRRVGMINLRRAYGESLSANDARRMVRVVFGNLGQSLVEGLQFARRFRQRADDAQEMYESEDPELERRILCDSRPRILVTGHLGSWEIAAALAAMRSGRPGAAVVRRIDNPFLNALWRRGRVRQSSEWIDKQGAAREALTRLRRGEDIAMLLDENGGYRGVFVPFFGTLASTKKTPAVLSLATGAPIVVGACIRRPGHPFLYRHALLEADRSLPPDEAIRDLTARIVSVYEAWIRDAPLQWRWIHWRWKTRPDGSEERYGRAELRRWYDVRHEHAGQNLRNPLPALPAPPDPPDPC